MRLYAISLPKKISVPVLQLGAFFGGGALATACLMDGRAPLAIALLSACRQQGHLLAVLSGSAVAATLAMDFTAGLRHCGVLVLVYAMFAAFRDTKYIQRELFRPLAAAGMTAAVELAYLLQAGLTAENIAYYLSYVAMVGMLSHYFQLLPARWQSRGRDTTLGTMRKRLELSAAAFRDLYNSFGKTGTPRNDENPAVVFDRAAEATCRTCGNCAVCWGKEYVTTFNALNDATPAMLRRGKSLSEDYPAHFRERCENLPKFLSAVNQELNALLLRRQYSRRLEAERQRARGQYAQLSEFLGYTAQQMETAVPAYAGARPFLVGGAWRPKEGESACGDTITHFETDQGLLCLLISDGMGSGAEAQRESRNAVNLLEQFLRAGVEPEPALRTINAALSLRSEDTGSFTTIDLMTVDLRRRQASLYKYGAAPTYVKRHGNVRRLTGAALPAGLQETHLHPSPICFPIEPDTFVLMVSDGVAGDSGDEWLQNTLAGWEGDDPQRLVSLLMGESRQRGGLKDDCSLLCLHWLSGGKEV